MHVIKHTHKSTLSDKPIHVMQDTGKKAKRKAKKARQGKEKKKKASKQERTTHTFIIETVNSVDAGALVVATEDEEVFRVLDLVCQQEADGLQRLFATIDIIAQEQIVSLWGEASILEQTEQVIVLAVDITYRIVKNPPGEIKRVLFV